MSKIDDLIAKYCPKGVVYKPIWELTTWDKKFNGVDKFMQPSVIKYPYLLAADMNALESDNGDVRLLSTGIGNIKYTTEALAGDNLCEGEIVAIPWGGTPNIKYYKGKFVTADNRIATSNDTNILSNKFLYYYLCANLDLITSFYRGAGIQHPSMKSVLSMQIPVPPLPVQEEIVRILDSFTMLEAELEAELEARKKQYEHYRDNLLNFGDISQGGVRLMALCEIANVTIGEFVHKNHQSEDGLYPVYNGGTSNTGFYNEYNHTSNNIIISARGANAGFVNRVFVNYWAGNSCYSVNVIDRKNINWTYVYYVLKNNQQKLIGEQQTGSIPAISKKQVEKFMIPVPPLAEQERIITILDKFDALVNDISDGLPAEIDARRKQYEYYRDKLLDFKELPNE